MNWRELGFNVLVFLWGSLALPAFLALLHWGGVSPEVMFVLLAFLSGTVSLWIFGR